MPLHFPTVPLMPRPRLLALLLVTASWLSVGLAAPDGAAAAERHPGTPPAGAPHPGAVEQVAGDPMAFEPLYARRDDLTHQLDVQVATIEDWGDPGTGRGWAAYQPKAGHTTDQLDDLRRRMTATHDTLDQVDHDILDLAEKLNVPPPRPTDMWTRPRGRAFTAPVALRQLLPPAAVRLAVDRARYHHEAIPDLDRWQASPSTLAELDRYRGAAGTSLNQFAMLFGPDPSVDPLVWQAIFDTIDNPDQHDTLVQASDDGPVTIYRRLLPQPTGQALDGTPLYGLRVTVSGNHVIRYAAPVAVP